MPGTELGYRSVESHLARSNWIHFSMRCVSWKSRSIPRDIANQDGRTFAWEWGPLW